MQFTRVQILNGRNVVIIGSDNTGYEIETRSVQPNGAIVMFICAFSPSTMDNGDFKVNVDTAAFRATISSANKETVCESKGGFHVGFLEKTVSDFWSKYVIVIN
jgi:hypothetical protein